jgi:hypothetical protein
MKRRHRTAPLRSLSPFLASNGIWTGNLVEDRTHRLYSRVQMTDLPIRHCSPSASIQELTRVHQVRNQLCRGIWSEMTPYIEELIVHLHEHLNAVLWVPLDI